MLTPDTILQNRYRVIRQLGQGGMGTVYEARALRLNTTVAIKEAHFSEERLRRQFEREAQLLAGLRHPALPRVIDHFDEDAGLFLVMDYVPGEDLWEWLLKKNAAFPVYEVLTWADQLLDALNYLHNQNPQIIHRDIKPQNLKVNEAGQIILLDFGLAKGFAGGQLSRPATSNSIFGFTPSYAPLEQIQGEGTDARSDLYSLAATIYNLMTNVVPADVLKRLIALTGGETEPIVPAHLLNPQISQSVSEVLMRALEIARNKRFATAAEMRRALREAAAAIRVPAPETARQPELYDLTPPVSDETREISKTPEPSVQVPPGHLETFNQDLQSLKTKEEEALETEAYKIQSSIRTAALPNFAAAAPTEVLPKRPPVTPNAASRNTRLPLLIGAAAAILLFALSAVLGLGLWRYSLNNVPGNANSNNAGLAETNSGNANSGNMQDLVTRLTKEEMEILLKDASPEILKRLAEDPELKQKQIDDIKQLLAMANQARKEGLAADAKVRDDLAEIRSEVIAVNYDREKNKATGAVPPFGTVGENEVSAFYEKPGNQAKFDAYLKRKIEQAKKNGTIPQDREITDKEISEAKSLYAKVQIYAEEAQENAEGFGAEHQLRVQLQIKIQHAQYLAKLYADKILKDKISATDQEIEQYIAAHPELDPKSKKAKAVEILQRVRSGEDFAKLAKEFSEDPGSKDKGGLYEGVKKGQMLPEFEQAALSLNPGEITGNVVETKLGYHIIKLEKKGTGKDNAGKQQETFNARHILISTMYSDPNNPFAQPVPITDKIKAGVEAEKERKVLEDIKTKNPVEVEDFEIPKPPDAKEQKKSGGVKSR